MRLPRIRFEVEWIPVAVPRHRFTVRGMMAAVAVIAVFLGIGLGVRAERRRSYYAAMAAKYAQNEGSCRAALSNGSSPKDAAYYARAAAYFGRMKAHYQRAASTPWSPAPPEPTW